MFVNSMYGTGVNCTRRKSYVGERFGKLIVREMVYGSKVGSKIRTQCICDCDCGNTVTVVADKLTSKRKTSCGCDTSKRRQESNRKNLVGQKFGRLTVLEMDWSVRPTKVLCKCDCGETVRVTGADLSAGHTQSCGCLQRERATAANTKDWSETISDYGVSFISRECMNSTGQWLWRCRCGKCGSEFVALPAKIMNGHITSCGCVTKSKREDLIQAYLSSLGVNFQTEYSIPNCKNTYVLRFDFAVFNEQSGITLIEYDGEQHYHPVPVFGGVNGFIKTKNRDNIKNKYCRENNIHLVRLPYTMTDAEIKNIITNIVYP